LSFKCNPFDARDLFKILYKIKARCINRWSVATVCILKHMQYHTTYCYHPNQNVNMRSDQCVAIDNP
jgi:hypothetical protein